MSLSYNELVEYNSFTFSDGVNRWHKIGNWNTALVSWSFYEVTMMLSFGYAYNSLCTIRFGYDPNVLDKRLTGWGLDNDNGSKTGYYIGFKKNNYQDVDLYIKMKSDLGHGAAIVYSHSQDSSLSENNQRFILNSQYSNYTDEDMDKIVDLYAESKTVWRYYATYDIELNDTTLYSVNLDSNIANATELFVEVGSVNGQRQCYGGTTINLIRPSDTSYGTKPSYITASMYGIAEWAIFYIYWDYYNKKFTYQVYNWLDTSGTAARDARVQVYWK